MIIINNDDQAWSLWRGVNLFYSAIHSGPLSTRPIVSSHHQLHKWKLHDTPDDDDENRKDRSFLFSSSSLFHFISTYLILMVNQVRKWPSSRAVRHPSKLWPCSHPPPSPVRIHKDNTTTHPPPSTVRKTKKSVSLTHQPTSAVRNHKAQGTGHSN